MKINEIELLNTVINHAYSAGYVCGLDEGKTTHNATVEQLKSQILRLQERCSWWQNKHKKAVENYENCIYHLKERIDLLKRGDNETPGTYI